MPCNPHDLPKSDLGIPPRVFRVLTKPQLFVIGCALGAASYLAALMLVPNRAGGPSQHDLALAKNLGFLFPSFVGVWVGWMRRSLFWAIGGLAAGLGVGACFAGLCGDEFLLIPITMVFPCVLGGMFSLVFGAGDDWVQGSAARLGKGLIAGFVLGFVYISLLNLLLLVNSPIDTIHDYVRMLWRNGPPAMGVAGGLYLILFLWSVSTKRDKSLIVQPNDRGAISDG